MKKTTKTEKLTLGTAMVRRLSGPLSDAELVGVGGGATGSPTICNCGISANCYTKPTGIC